MKRLLSLLLAAALLAPPASPQTASDPNEGTRLLRLGSSHYQFTWWARAGNPYLVEYSDDLAHWTYLPSLFPGTGSISPAVNLSPTGTRLFVRLNTDPFHTDSDADGIPDGWEVLYGLNPRDPSDAFAMAPGGLTFLQKFQMGLNPTVADSDGDGVNDDVDGWPLDPDLSPPPVLETQYAVLDLSLAGLNPGDYVIKVNNRCQAIGRADVSLTPFFWDSGVRTAIPMFSAPYLNNNGVVSGDSEYQDEYLTTYAARWSAGQSSPELLYGYEPSANVDEPVFVRGYGINDSGAIVGTSASSFNDPFVPYSCGTIWAQSSPALVGALHLYFTEGSPPDCWPIALNNSGVIVGTLRNQHDDPFIPNDAFVMEAGVVTHLPNPPIPPPPYDGTQYPWAKGINQAGNVATGEMSWFQPVIWVKKSTGWVAKNIGPYSSTTGKNEFVPGIFYGPNERTEFVGQRYDNGDTPFILQNGKLVDLNTRVPPGWLVTFANSINDSGVISATVWPVDQNGQATGTERSALLLPVEMRITDRDDPKKKWTDNVVKTAPVYSGKSTGDMVSWKLAGTESWTNATFSWSAEGPETKTGPSGTGKNEWKIADGDEDTANDWLKWKPGKYKIKCAISFAGGSTSTAEFEQEVGVRTDDTVVVGWIDQTKVALNPAGVQAALLEVWPVWGIQLGDGDNAKIKAALLAEQIANRGVGAAFDIGIPVVVPTVHFNAFSQADKDYALKWMFRYANNPSPPPSFRDGEGFFSQTDLDAFTVKQDKTLYKLLNHYQAKFLVMDDGMIKSITPIRGMKPRAAIGNTKDPARFWEIDGVIDRLIKAAGWMLGYPVGGIFEGIPSDKNDDNAVEGNYTLKHFNEGTPDQPALDAFKHLTGHDQGYIWSSITFYSDLGYYHDAPFTRDPKPETFYQGGIKTQVYPSYWIYINGELRSTVEQAASPWALFPNTDRCR